MHPWIPVCGGGGRDVSWAIWHLLDTPVILQNTIKLNCLKYLNMQLVTLWWNFYLCSYYLITAKIWSPSFFLGYTQYFCIHVPCWNSALWSFAHFPVSCWESLKLRQELQCSSCGSFHILDLMLQGAYCRTDYIAACCSVIQKKPKLA